MKNTPNRANSGVSSNPWNQTHNYLDGLIACELQDNVFTDVDGFLKFFNHISIDQEIYTTRSTMTEFEAWMECTNKSTIKFEMKGRHWFNLLSNLAQHPSRFFYGSGDYPLGDAHHEAVRKCDIFLSRTLSDEEDQMAINPPANNRVKDENMVKHSWKHVLVPGEFKYNSREDCSQRILIQLAGYVREVYGAQPGRMFVHAFTVCGSIVRFWLFDRASVSISKAYNILEKPNKSLLVRALLGYTMMSAGQLGFDERYKDVSFEPFITSKNTPLPTYFHLGTNHFRLNKLMYSAPSIISRGTLCWEAKHEVTGATCVVKDAWKSKSRPSEAEFWNTAKQKGVLSCMKIVAYEDAEEVSWDESNINNLRRNLNPTTAKLFLGPNNVAPVFNHSITQSRKPSAEMQSAPLEDNIFTAPQRDAIPMVSSGRKRKLLATDPPYPISKRSNVIDINTNDRDRTHHYLITGNLGNQLRDDTPARQLLEALRDAIKCTPSYPFFFIYSPTDINIYRPQVLI